MRMNSKGGSAPAGQSTVSGDAPRRRPRIAFFDYPDVFEDFYPHYGVTQEAFATSWQNTANHQWLRIVQQEIGDVVWYVPCIHVEHGGGTHEVTGCRVKYVASSLAHRAVWKLFYLKSFSWRLKRYYRGFAALASYLAPLSWRLWKTLRRDKPDLIFVQDYCSGKYDVLLFFSGLLKIPLITFHSGSTPDQYLGKVFRRRTLKKADWIFPSGARELRILEERFGVRSECTSIIRPPIDTEVYRPAERRAACEMTGFDPSRRYILYVGRLQDSVKRIRAMIQVFSELAGQYRDVDFVIVGGGGDEEVLRRYAEERLPGRIHFRGWVSEDGEKRWIYNIAECLVLNSWREASPAVIGEAFACGIPVISSNVGGIADLVIQGKSGWLFPAGDDSMFKKHLAEALDDPGKLRSMREAIRKLALERVSEGEIAKSLKKGFEVALAMPRGTALFAGSAGNDP